MTLFRVGAMFMILLFTLLPAAGQTDEPSSPSVSWQIAFVSERDGGSDLYIMNPDGTNVRRLTRSQRINEYDPPVWSPDGTHFAYEYGSVISVVDADGTNGRGLINMKGGETEPAWSPDGTQLAFVSGEDEESEIYTIAIDGSNLRRLTDNDVPDTSPAWSPDGERIAFASMRDSRSNIYVIYLNDPSYAMRVTNDITNPYDYAFMQGEPVWSPDGNQIAFMATCCKTNNIYVVNADGTDMHRVHDNSFSFTWSPDSTQIALHRIDHNPSYDINLYTKNVDGSRLRQLTGYDSDDYDYQPAWSPDGTQIAFTSEREDNTDIYVMDVDGTDVRRLTTDEDRDYLPMWVPVPTGG